MHRFNRCRPSVSLPLILFFLFPLVPVAGAQTPPLLDGDAVMHQSLAAMHDSLHAVHATGSDTWTIGKRRANLRVVGDCVMQPVGLRSAFRLWGTRPTSAKGTGIIPERYDREFIVLLSADMKTDDTWERNALTDQLWRQDNSNNDALVVISLCPAFPLLGQVFRGGPTLKNMGAASLEGTSTWHLHGRQSETHGKQTARSQLDVYIDQETHYLIKIKSDTIQLGKILYRSTWTRTFSRFNGPVVIEPPQ